MKTYLMVLLCAFSTVVSATNYYVKNGGNNNADGKSDANAWATIGKVNTINFVAGDSVFFKKGDVWREKLMINSSGGGGKYITYGSYGTGNKPKILGSTQAITWSAEGHTNIWVSATTVSDPKSLGMSGSDIFFNNSGTTTHGINKAYSSTFSNLTAEYNWTWNGNKVYVYASSDPGTRYTSVEVPQLDWGISINEKEYIIIDGLELQFGCSGGITTASYPTANKSYLTIKNCSISYSGLVTPNTIPDVDNYGIHACYSHMLLQNNVVHDMGRRSISVYNYGTGFTTTDITIEGNTLYNGFHTTGIDMSCGSGGAGSANFDGIIIRNNLVYDDAASFNYGSELFNIESYYTTGVNINNIQIYGNILKNAQNSGIHIYGVHGADIFNNTFYGHNISAAGNTSHIKIQNECTDVVIKNNIFYTSLSVESNSRGNAIYTSSSQTTASIIADYNIYYRIDPSYRIIELKGGATIYKMNQIATIKSALGWETHGQTISPAFVSTSDLHLLGGSPAIGTGIAIPQVKTDFDGNVFSDPPNVGCYATPGGTTNLTYVSSVIENVSPSLLSMTYNTTLVNIVPASSAFAVQVNSVSRTVGSVAISGGKVQLTLSTPVVFGDIVTVSYTKPATNPLQTSSGGQAASISAQPVTNNCGAVSPVYVSSSIENATPSLLTMTYNLALANIVPASSAFAVQVNSVSRAVGSVAISGGKVQLTLATPVVFGDIVTVSYTKPATNPLQTSSGGQAASISTQPVTNNCGAVSPVYVSSSIENATPSLLTMTYNLTLANIVPASSAFAVQVNSVSRAVGSVAISGGKVQLTLSTPVVFGDIVTVSYTKPATNPLQTSSGGQAASISTQPVTNNCGAVSPVYVSSSIENATPSLLTMTYNLTLANIVPASSAFAVQVNSVSRAVGSVAISGGKVQLTLSTPVVFGDIVTVSYTKPATNPLQTSSGGQAASISAQPVTNNSGAVSPVYVSSSIENSTPSLLSMTYNLALANIVPASSAFAVQVNSVSRAVGSVAIVGGKVQLTLSTPVVFGHIVTVSYTKPATNPLQTSSGGQAASISTQPVTNNCGAVSPVYVSSSIENATPSLLTMTYNLTLANIVPASSAFAVQVNSVSRAVGSVAISGGKVQLTLSTPVVFGDIVTVSYTKPATNPLQTSSGGQAASISAQPVTNNSGAVSPVYVSSSIENSTPSLLSMTYNLALANIVPASSAFAVQVNSVSRAVGSVAIVGGKVQLTLSTPVVFGDIVTVSYTKPATNPLQTSSVGQAASIYSTAVMNNINYVNTPPNIVINYSKSVYSGFVGEIDASLSYDANKDPLKFEWIVPGNLEVNSTTGQKIQFLAPIVKYSMTINFVLNVSDGYSIQTKSIPVTILPYRTRFPRWKTTSIISGNTKGTDDAYNLIDNNIETSWLSNGSDQSVIFELDNPYEINYIEVAFQKDKNTEAHFDIWASVDNLIWEPLLIDATSSNFATGYQIFDIPEAKNTTKYSYVKLINHGNQENLSVNISEFALFGTPDLGEYKMNLYPNPAKTQVNIVIEGPDTGLSESAGISNGIIRIYNIEGQMVAEQILDANIRTILFPLNIKSGTYFVNLISNGVTIAVQKLIIIN